MKQFLMTLVVFFLVSGAIAGYFLFLQKEEPVADFSEPAVTEEPAEEIKEEPAEEPAEEPEEEIQEEEEEPAPAKEKRKYYRFTVGTERDNQNVRATPNGKILYTVPKGSSGYIVVLDDEWSLVEMRGDIAYMATRYLDLEKIPKSQFPKKLRKLTAADAGKKVSL